MEARLEAKATDFVVRLAFLGLFAYWSLELVRPFLPVIVWAVLLTVALYPAYAWLVRRLGGRKALSAFVVTALVLITLLGPISMLVANLANSVQRLYVALEAGSFQIPPPPPNMQDLPIIGDGLAEGWALASTNLEDAIRRYGPMMLPAGKAATLRIAAVGGEVLVFVLSVIIAGFLFVPGPRLAAGARQFAGRLIAPRGAHFVDLAGQTIRNISRGVIGVAMLQSLLAGVIFKVAEVPFAGFLAFAILLLCIVQIGPALVLVPVLIWAWMAMTGTYALILTVLLVPVMLIDNVLKPLLMARGLATPMLVILTGVIGGTLTHGLLGLFLGPIVLAVFYDLVVAWVQLETSGEAPEEQ